MKLIVGLGNIGKEYDLTRHNIGFMCLDNYLGNVSWKSDFKACSYKTNINGEAVLFIKPSTYMNLSGEAVRYYVDYYKISLDDILIIQDDLDLNLGKIRIKYDSSSGGHNGIKSISKCLGTNKYLRLKIGISKPSNNNIDYVLGKFLKDELDILNDSFVNCNKIINDFINNVSITDLMGRYN